MLKSEFFKRTISLFLMVVIFYGIVLFSQKLLILSLLFLALIAGYEYHSGLKNHQIKINILFLFGASCLFLSLSLLVNTIGKILLADFFFLMSLTFFLISFKNKIHNPLAYIIFLLWIMLPVNFALLIVLFLENTYFYFAFSTLVVMSTDTSAYLGGKKFGVHKLAANISPKKTIEGSLFGILGGVIMGLLIYIADLNIFKLNTFSLTEIILLSFTIALISQIGDLIESYFKRLVGIKNSGTIIPGHGGILDRLDGQLPSIMFIFIYIYLKDFLLPALGNA